MASIRRAFALWFPVGVAVTLLSGLAYGLVQQVTRLGGDEPQIGIARDVASDVASGRSAAAAASLAAVRTSPPVDPSASLAPFVIVFDQAGGVVFSTARLGGGTFQPPKGVLEAAAGAENRVTWQPRSGVRVAAVVVPVKGGSGGYVLAGRSLAVVEQRIEVLTRLAMLGWAATLVATFVAAFVVAWGEGRRGLPSA